jgi:hypothetical protein
MEGLGVNRRTRMLRALAVVCALIALSPRNAYAQDIDVHGYLDFRAVLPSDETSWSDGGLGKSRYGGGKGVEAKFGGGALAATWHVAPSLIAIAELQYPTGEERRLDLLDAYLRYRPVSITPWRWSLKLGMFFPPVSLENDAIGWTSPWTLTPSAINSWVGEELRTIGAEVRFEHRGTTSTFEGAAAVFANNDPAGELIAARGWSLGDLTSGLNSSLREPDVFAPLTGEDAPVDYRPFDEIDNRVGWYANLSWQSPTYGKITLLRYDNRAEPSRFEHYDEREVFAWHTRFWSLGAQTRIDDVVLIAQAMDGSTAFEPVPHLYLDTKMHAGYLLAGWDRGKWNPALRVDFFSLRQLPNFLPDPLSEHGHALTAALNWRPNDRLRVTGEWLRIDSTRNQRLLEGLSPRQIDEQLQLSVRVLF